MGSSAGESSTNHMVLEKDKTYIRYDFNTGRPIVEWKNNELRVFGKLQDFGPKGSTSTPTTNIAPNRVLSNTVHRSQSTTNRPRKVLETDPAVKIKSLLGE